MTDWLMIAVGVVLTVGTALFVAGEFSLVAHDNSQVENREIGRSHLVTPLKP